MSLPYNTIYKKASDVTNELTENNVNMVGKWDPAKQKSITYYYAKGKWRGKNFDINPGDGIFLNSINPTWSWVINGTDFSNDLTFTLNPPGKANMNWISLPYTNSYEYASDIVMDIEGSLVTMPTRIIAIGFWDASSQAEIRYYWNSTAGQWDGTDFSIISGDSFFLEIISTFTWIPDLITPAVP